RRDERIHEAGEVEVALTRQTAPVPAPRQMIHLQPWRVRHLHHRDLVPWYDCHGREVKTARQDVKAVQDDADIVAVRAPDDLPGVPVVPNMAAPGQSLKADPHAATRGPFPEFREIL